MTMISAISGSYKVVPRHSTDGRDRAAAPERSQREKRADGRLTAEEQRLISKLKARDREVRVREQAYKAAGGRHPGVISYKYQVGPDGKRYAVGGEVAIEKTGFTSDPHETIDELETVRAAALAATPPSAKDRAVAIAALVKIKAAEAELRELTEAERAEAFAAHQANIASFNARLAYSEAKDLFS